MNTKDRNANIEILRCVLMLMIVTLHYLNRNLGGLLAVLKPEQTNYYIAWGIEALCYVSVNCFVLISGFFSSETRFNFSKNFRLILQTFFYSAGIYLLFCAFGAEQFSIKTFIAGYAFPTIHGTYWFVAIYIVLTLLIPFLNLITVKLSQKQMLLLLCILTVVLSVIPSVFPIFVDQIGVSNGYSLIWFIFMYFVSSYIRLYIHEKTKTHIIALFFAGGVLFTCLLKFIQLWLLGKETWDFYKYNSIFILFSSVMLFLFFIKLRKKTSFLSKFAVFIGPHTLSVFLIHSHPLLSTMIWDKFIRASEYCGGYLFIPHLVASVIVIFTACVLIDFLRAGIFCLLSKLKPVQAINTCLNNYSSTINGFFSSSEKYGAVK